MEGIIECFVSWRQFLRAADVALKGISICRGIIRGHDPIGLNGVDDNLLNPAYENSVPRFLTALSIQAALSITHACRTSGPAPLFNYACDVNSVQMFGGNMCMASQELSLNIIAEGERAVTDTNEQKAAATLMGLRGDVIMYMVSETWRTRCHAHD